MSRRVSYANYLVVAAKSFLKVEEEDSEVRSTFYFVEIHQLLRVNFCNTFTRLHQEVSTQVEREALLLGLLSMLRRILRQKKSFLRVVHLSYPIEAFVASMSSIRWMITPELSFMKQWNNKLYQLPRLASSVL